jgi:hypothetical protein
VGNLSSVNVNVDALAVSAVRAAVQPARSRDTADLLHTGASRAGRAPGSRHSRRRQRDRSRHRSQLPGNELLLAKVELLTGRRFT